LRVRLAGGTPERVVLPDSEVFEDRTPRLADLDGDGRTEIITIRASLRQGGSVAVYGVRGEQIVELGATPFIGRSNRWLNIAGIADFLGRGDLQIAFVETPHIGGTLKLATFRWRRHAAWWRAKVAFPTTKSGRASSAYRLWPILTAMVRWTSWCPMRGAQQTFGRALCPEASRLATLDPAGGVGHGAGV
jgi:hypothetical protein